MHAFENILTELRVPPGKHYNGCLLLNCLTTFSLSPLISLIQLPQLQVQQQQIVALATEQTESLKENEGAGLLAVMAGHGEGSYQPPAPAFADELGVAGEEVQEVIISSPTTRMMRSSEASLLRADLNNLETCLMTSSREENAAAAAAADNQDKGCKPPGTTLKAVMMKFGKCLGCGSI